MRGVASRVLQRQTTATFECGLPSCSSFFSTETGNVITLDAVTRTSSGSRAASKLRARGLVPGVLFSGEGEKKTGDATLLAFDKKAVSAVHQNLGSYGFACQVFDIRVRDGGVGGEGGDGSEGETAPTTGKTTHHRVLGRQVHVQASSAELENVTCVLYS